MKVCQSREPLKLRRDSNSSCLEDKLTYYFTKSPAVMFSQLLTCISMQRMEPSSRRLAEREREGVVGWSLFRCNIILGLPKQRE